MKRICLKDRILPKYSKGEEIFNMTSHIVGAVLGIVATTLCVVFAAVNNNGYGIVSGAIYGVTMIILYTMSSIYHGLKPEMFSKKVFQILDHCSIFLLIAGSYTPFCLTIFRAVQRLQNFGMVSNAIMTICDYDNPNGDSYTYNTIYKINSLTT